MWGVKVGQKSEELVRRVWYAYGWNYNGIFAPRAALSGGGAWNHSSKKVGYAYL